MIEGVKEGKGGKGKKERSWAVCLMKDEGWKRRREEGRRVAGHTSGPENKRKAQALPLFLPPCIPPSPANTQVSPLAGRECPLPQQPDGVRTNKCSNVLSGRKIN